MPVYIPPEFDVLTNANSPCLNISSVKHFEHVKAKSLRKDYKHEEKIKLVDCLTIIITVVVR